MRLFGPARGTMLLAGLLACTLGCADGGASATNSGGDQKREGDHDHDHDGHDHDADLPQDFASGVAMLQGHYDAIRDAYASDPPGDAHDALHEVGPLLDALPALAEKAGLSEADRNAIREAREKMLDGYMNIDGAIHDGETPDYAAEADSLKSAMEAIAGSVPPGA